MELYHVLNRGVDKRNVVMDDFDRFRFVHSLFVFNDTHVLNPNHGRKGEVLKAFDRDPLVYIHAWCLMDNHYHLLVSPINDDLKLLSQFIKKLNMGYARYFNERHERSGYLWQGKYKKIHIEKDAHFLYIPFYIHLNPLDFISKSWRSGSIDNIESAVEFLTQYRWSSYQDYSGEKNFSSVIYKELLQPILGNNSAQIKIINQIISSADLAQGSLRIEQR